MRDIRYRNILKYDNGQIKLQYTSVDELEGEDSWQGKRNYILIDRNLCIKFKGKNGKEIEVFEGDIVKVMTDRVPEYEQNIRSMHDKIKIESRNIVVYKNLKWMLDIDTPFNNKILELKGKETEKRRLNIWEELSAYDFWNEWNVKHNSHAYWHQLEVIGNIYENKNLLWE
jgi:hypothetical protein